MLDPPTASFWPALNGVYEILSPWTEALLRVAIGLALVPHGLRMTFGFFRKTGLDVSNLTMLADQLERSGYRLGRFWAPAIAATELVAGPMLALGLFTRLAAVPIVIFLAVACVERWRVGGYFWNTLGLEYPLMWVIAALYFLVHGDNDLSLDRALIGRQF